MKQVVGQFSFFVSDNTTTEVLSSVVLEEVGIKKLIVLAHLLIHSGMIPSAWLFTYALIFIKFIHVHSLPI